jgi:hypothetical protein
LQSSRYIYSCAACGGPVEKLTPCHSEKDKEGNKTDYAGLGGWRCAKDGAGIKVVRILK